MNTGTRVVGTTQPMARFQTFSNLPQPQDLDYLINDLRFPPKGATVQKFLGYIYHYLPYIKNEHNLRLVMSAFLNNQLMFGQFVPSMEQLYPMIEVFKLVTDTKLKISQPTLSIKTWYTVIRKELENFVKFNPVVNSWKILPIVCGITLSNELRDHLYSQTNPISYGYFFKQWDQAMKSLFRSAFTYSVSPSLSTNILDLSIVSLSLYFDSSLNVYSFTKGTSPTFIIERLTKMITDPVYELSILNTVIEKYFSVEKLDPSVTRRNPILLHFNKISTLLECYLKEDEIINLNSKISLFTLTNLLNFNKKLNQLVANSRFNTSDNTQDTQEYWDSMKRIFFGQIIIFQGILTACMKGDLVSNSIYSEICLVVLQNLYYLHFILLSIGMGGFDSFNFVYYFALDVTLINSKYQFEILTQRLISDYQEINYYELSHNYIMQSKVLFILGLWEHYLKNSTDLYVQNTVAPLCMEIAKQANVPNLVEAAHSTLLVMFANSKKTHIQILNYLNLLYSQFPNFLSSNQLSIAVETLGKSILSSGSNITSNEFLGYLLDKCEFEASGKYVHHSTAVLSSAQPVTEINANSTLSHIDEDSGGLRDVVDATKHDQPSKYVPDFMKLPESKNNYKFEQRFQPETTREALIFSMFNLIPYIPLENFVFWLEKLMNLVKNSNPSEQNFLLRLYWKVISENLDTNRAAYAYKWWYEEKRLAKI